MSPTSSSAWVRGLLRMFADQGLEPSALLARCGLSAQRVAEPGARFAPDDITRLWEVALQLSGNPALGIDAELAARHIDFQEVGVVMLACADLREGVDHAARYLALMSSATVFRLEADARGCWIEIGHIGASRPIPLQRSAYSLLAVLVMCRWVARRAIRPLAVELAHPPAAGEAQYNAAFGSPVSWRSSVHRMLLGTTDLNTPIPSRDARLLPWHARTLDDRLQVLNQEGITPHAQEAIAEALLRGEPRRRDIAQQLGLSERALTRRLQQENQSFQTLLDGTRKDLAKRHLSENRLSLAQIGHCLGFSDESNFVRACRRWFGMSPGMFRDAQTGPSPGAESVSQADGPH